MKNTLIEHKHYIEKHGEDPPQIRNWKWGTSEYQQRRPEIMDGSRREA